MFKIPMIVLHFPLTSSTHSTKDTTTTAILAKPMITLPIIYISMLSQNPKSVPGRDFFFVCLILLKLSTLSECLMFGHGKTYTTAQ